MVKEDFSACPKCDFPVLHSEFMRFFLEKVIVGFSKIKGISGFFFVLFFVTAQIFRN